MRHLPCLWLPFLLALNGAAQAQLGPVPGLPASSLGQPNGAAALDGNGRASGMMVLPNGATTPRTLSARAADVIRVQDYGAKCDGSTDDGPAFNAAAAAARARVTGGGPVTVRYTWTGCVAVIRTTINLTGISSGSFLIDGAGGLLEGATNGKPVIDAMHSENLTWNKVSIFGVPGTGNEPSIGIQIGRTNTHDPVDGQHFIDAAVYGYYTFTAMYNLGSEVTEFTHPYFANFTPATTGLNPLSCFALVEDADNHWNIGSAYTPQAVAQDTFMSHDDNLFLNPQITTSGGCTPVFEGGSSGHKYIGGYIANGAGDASNNVAAGVMVVLWNPANSVGFAVNNLDFDNMHMEQEPTDIFYVTGGNTAPVMNGLRWDEHIDQASNSIFKLDPAITAATINDLDLRVAGFLVTGTKVFDAPAKWKTSGVVKLASAAPWNPAVGTFSGVTLLGGQGSANLQSANFGALTAGTLTTGQLQTNGTVSATGSLNGPCVSTGYDATNGVLGLSCGTTGTPYINLGGISNTKILGDGAGQISFSSSTGLLAFMQTRPAANGGNLFGVNGAIGSTGGAGFNGAAPVAGRTDISGSCGGSAVCQKMAALLVNLGLATGSVTP